MTDVAVNIDYDPIFQSQYLPATFATSSAQPNPAFSGFDLTGEQSFDVARPFQSSFDCWSSLIAAMTFQLPHQFPIYQLSDQDLTNSPQSHNNNTSTSQQQQKSSNEMTATTAFPNQQYPDVDTSNQQSTIIQTPSFVEPPINYYPSTSTTAASNPVILNNNLDSPSVTNNNYSPRNVYIGNYPQQQQQFLEHNYHACPTTHPSRVGITTNPQLINYSNNCRIIYQGSSPASTTSIGRQHHQKQISGTIGSNVPNVSYSHSRPDNVASTSSSIASNLITFNPTTNAPTMLVTSSMFDQSFTTKPQAPQVPQTTITIPNSIGSSVSSSESTSPTKQSYSYSGPPKSYYSRLPLYDRPFKCDTCPQSFNRNHDLKRHKRIHLAVKPYPCPCCEKQFSRKDALKRHILVKGCNNTHKGTTNNKRSTSPNNNNNKIVDDSSNSSGQKYDSSIESESPIKSEPTSDNNSVRYI